MHVHVTHPLPVRHPLTAAALRHAAERAAMVLLAAYGLSLLVWSFTDSNANDLATALGLYALAALIPAWLAPRITGVVLVLSSTVLGPPLALLARWLGETYAASIGDGLLVALFAVPFSVGALLLAATAHRRKPA